MRRTILNYKPALRFKDEQGKDYPDWYKFQLGSIGKTFNGLTGKKKTHFGKGKPYIQYLQIFENSKINVCNFGRVEIGRNESQNEVRKGDIFFTTSSETPNDVGAASVLLENVTETYLNSFCFGFRVNKKILLPEFARFSFRESNFRKKVVRLSQGSTRYNLSKTTFMKVSVNLPSIKEQQRIASFLSSVEVKIEQLSRKKDLLERYKKGMMMRLFSPVIRFKDEQGVSYRNWKSRKLGDVANIISGGTPKTTEMGFWNGSINWFTPTEIDSKYSNDSIRRISKQGLTSSSAKLLPVGTILFTSRATIGRVSIATQECTTNQGFQSFVGKRGKSGVWMSDMTVLCD